MPRFGLLLLMCLSLLLPTLAAPAGTDASGADAAGDVEVRPMAADARHLGTRAVILGVARVEQRASAITVWAFACNPTETTFEIPLSGLQMLGANGVPLDAVSYRPAGQSVRLKPSSMLFMWPAFRLSTAAAQGRQRLEFRMRLEGYATVRVAIEERMTNLGPFNDLPPYVRDQLAIELKANRSFKWWGQD